MTENMSFKRRAERLSRAEFEAMQILKSNGWIVITDVDVRDGRPELGDGSPTYRFEGRQPIAIFKSEAGIEYADTVAQVDDSDADPVEETKKRGRPKKQ